MKLQVDRIGTLGLLLTAIVSPCCFPLFGIGLTTLGFGSFRLLGGWTMWIFQGLVVVSLIGIFIAYKQHKNIFPLAVGLVSAGIIFFAYHFDNSDDWQTAMYVGILGLFISAGQNHYINRHQKIACATCTTTDGQTVILESTITCPKCGQKKKEIMPTDACQFFYECDNCKTVLKPKQGDCCVYCSYGTVKCPSIQSATSCC